MWIRQLGQTAAVAVEVVASNPFFSPRRRLGGFLHRGRTVEGTAIGGAPVPIVTTTERAGGATWGADGTIVFATSGGLYAVPENGGAPRLLMKPDSRRKELRYAWPQIIPGGSSVLFTVIPEGSIDGAQIALMDLKTLETRIVLKGGSAPRYAATGHLLYAAGQSLKAVAFDPSDEGDPWRPRGVSGHRDHDRTRQWRGRIRRVHDRDHGFHPARCDRSAAAEVVVGGPSRK